jgi:hypothetical protein
MFTLHLSRFLEKKGPPGPEAQAFNALIHREPYSFLVYGAVWSFNLLFGAPLAGIALLWITLYEGIRYFLFPRRRIEPNNKQHELAVVITGCDSGFGQELAIRLSQKGFVVFAGCLKSESIKQYEFEPTKIIPLIVDVTKDAQVQSVHPAVQTWLDDPKATKKRFLHALVNNAGVLISGHFDWLELSDFQVAMDGKFLRYSLSLARCGLLLENIFSELIKCAES